MLRKLTVALIAASVFAAPVLAETGSTGTQTPAAKPAAAAPGTPSGAQTSTTKPVVATPAKPSDAAAPTNNVKRIKKSRHTGKQVRHIHKSGMVKASAHVKGARVVAHKVNPSGTGAVR
jgi:hypothetical protein